MVNSTIVVMYGIQYLKDHDFSKAFVSMISVDK